MKGFARREFQLVLLRRMADYRPGLVEDAMRSLGADRTEMREVNARWQRMLRSRSFPGGRRRYEAVLGPPTVEPRRIGDVPCAVARWQPFPLWPDLCFEILMAPDGTVLHEWLVRAPGAPAPRLRSVDDLVPWTCVVGDVGAAFPGAEHKDGDAPSRWQVVLTMPDGTSRTAHFVWGLLQDVV